MSRPLAPPRRMIAALLFCERDVRQTKPCRRLAAGPKAPVVQLVAVNIGLASEADRDSADIADEMTDRDVAGITRVGKVWRRKGRGRSGSA